MIFKLLFQSYKNGYVYQLSENQFYESDEQDRFQSENLNVTIETPENKIIILY